MDCCTENGHTAASETTVPHQKPTLRAIPEPEVVQRVVHIAQPANDNEKEKVKAELTETMDALDAVKADNASLAEENRVLRQSLTDQKVQAEPGAPPSKPEDVVLVQVEPLMDQTNDAEPEKDPSDAVDAAPPTRAQFFDRSQLVGIGVGCVLFLVFMCVELDEKYPMANDMAAIAALISAFWVFQVMPLPATSLLPMALIPLCGIAKGKDIAKSYWSGTHMLFVGAFVVDIAIEHVRGHERVALKVLLRVGVKYPALVAATFMGLAFFMSMFCSNTATTVMLTPFATGLLDTAKNQQKRTSARSTEDKAEIQRGHEEVARFSKGILLCMAYGATTGGMATIIGTPPNGVLEGQPLIAGMITMVDWMSFAMVPACVMGLLGYVVVVFTFLRGINLTLEESVLREAYIALGPVSRDEMVVAFCQFLQIFFWITRPFILKGPVPTVDDAVIACLCAVPLFLIPSSKRPMQSIMTWDVIEKHMPWGVLILMGGGFALATGFKSSNLTAVIGDALAGCAEWSLLGLYYVIIFTVCFLTEVTSNTATAGIILPIMAGVATTTLIHPLALMLPATLACSFAFMLPAATPPNSVVFATERLSIVDFVRTGLPLNIITIVVVTPIILFFANAIYDVGGPFPQWACDAVPDKCVWLSTPGTDGTACSMLANMTCKLRGGEIITYLNSSGGTFSVQ